MAKLTVAEAKKAVRNLNRKIAKDNRQFGLLEPAAKRVEIAKDVIAQIKANKLVPSQGVWLNTSFNPIPVKDTTEVQKILNKVNSCEGCAIGGMFMCAVKKADKLTLKEAAVNKYDKKELEYVNFDEKIAFKYLRRFFTNHQLALIEVAFEGGNGGTNLHKLRGLTLDAFNAAAVFCLEVGASAKMRLIMENIIVGEGKFDPTRKPVEQKIYVTPGFAALSNPLL